MKVLDEFITFQQAMEKETNTLKFVYLDGIYIGKKLGNELFCDFTPTFETVKHLKNALKVYKPIVVPDSIVYYDGIIRPVLFAKQYTSDATDVQPFSLLARAWNGEFDIDTAQKKYLEAMTQ